MRGRDALGRPVPADDPGAVPAVPEQALPDAEALTLAQSLLDDGRAFGAHEVLEASWKATPRDDPARRRIWQGLAQVCVGITHLQRGNRVGAARLLRRGAGNLAGHPVAEQASAAATAVEQGAEPAPIRLRGCAPPPPGQG